MSTVENFQFFQTGCVVFILSHMEAKICMEKKEKKEDKDKEAKICMEKKEGEKKEGS